VVRFIFVKIVILSNMKFKVVLEPAEEGGYTVYVPSLPGCISEGDTKEEALKNIKEAIELYLEPKEESISLKNGVELVELAV
jgi:predicted RNase H-like HicB family nuclease